MTRTLERFLRSLEPSLRGLETEVHPDDPMLRFARRLTCGHRELAELEYLRSGLHAYRVLRRIFEGRFGSAGPPSVLDFGSGWGRTTRFLASELPPSRITVAEIDAAAVEFQQQVFAVRGLVTGSDPEPLPAHDAIVALSVLTHLPEPTFRAWLAAWWQALRPGGALVFTTLDESVMYSDRTMPESGFHFEQVSESLTLESSQYGSTWVRRSWLEGVLAELVAGEGSWKAWSRGLFYLQDLWVVTKGGRAPETLDARPGPVGYLDRCHRDGETLELGGWAAAGRPDEVPLVRIRLGDETAETRPTSPRPESARHLGREPESHLGWSVRMPAPRDSSVPLEVVAEDRRGETYLVFVGSPDRAELFLALRRTTDELEDAAARLAVVEASGFGRARRRWMRLKQALGLGRPAR